jgi:predicted amidohydrolase YtcJ
MNITKLAWPLLGILFLAACEGPEGGAPNSLRRAPSADLIFIGEHILTADPNTQDATAVAVRDGQIIKVTHQADILALKGHDTRVVVLGDRALVPGFIDSHGHLGFGARRADFVNLSSPPVGTAENVDDVVALLRAHIEKQQPAEGEWVVGYGYDDSLLAENRHPNRDDLDKVSATIPLYLMHVSGHLGVANSAALAASNIHADSKDPAGGVIRRRPGSQEPNGVLEEKAASRVLFRQLGALDPVRFEAMFRQTLADYAAYGITTAQDGATNLTDIKLMRAAAAREPFPVDVASYRSVQTFGPGDVGTFDADPDYRGGFRVAGVKFVLDGSPQGRTAWLTQPYTAGPPGAAADYVAYPTMEPAAYKSQVAKLIARGVPLLVHANGDAAMDLMIEGIAEAVGDNVPDHRSVIIHAQLMRADQLDKAKTLGIVPSFFSAHTFFWGDWHLQSFGPERGENISPARWAIDRGVHFTIHNDAPVVPPDMMRLLWAAVNRTTRSGHVIGPEQRLTVQEALYAATMGGAYQLFEEDSKGSITEGKRADFVILGADPTTADPMTIKDIPILETIARGRTVYKR